MEEVTVRDEAKAKPRTPRMAQMAQSRKRRRVDCCRRSLERGKECRRLQREREKERGNERARARYLPFASHTQRAFRIVNFFGEFLASRIFLGLHSSPAIPWIYRPTTVVRVSHERTSPRVCHTLSISYAREHCALRISRRFHFFSPFSTNFPVNVKILFFVRIA